MVSTAQALLHLYPGSVPLRDWVVQSSGGVETVAFWSDALGSQPSEQTIEAAKLPAAKAERIAAIKAARDRIKIDGVTVGEHRFHSDPDSRTQQLGLVIMGASVPPVQWKTLGGGFVTMTQTLAGQIFQATAARDMAVFGRAEALIAAIKAAATVESVEAIDIDTGWPA